MSTPFPLEEQSQETRSQPTWDPWKEPQSPGFFAGMGFHEDTAYLGPFYRMLEAAGSGAAKGAAVLNGLYASEFSALSHAPVIGGVAQQMAGAASEVEQNARERVRAMTPDPATTGTATQVLHGVGEGAYLLSTGALLGGAPAAAGAVGGTEGGSRYQELKEQGVGTGTAAASGALAAVTAGAGAFLPAGLGSTLATRLLSGAAGNTAFGAANRYADHAILEAGGYPEMAEQQKALDASQMLVDAALGATFGAIHHAGAEGKAAEALKHPDTQDAALTANLALRDRAAAPGVPVDPAAANAHQAALEKATGDLLQGKPVDVSDTGVDRAQFMQRPAPDEATPLNMFVSALKETGFLDEEANLQDLEAQFAQRRGETPEETAPRAAPPETPGEDDEKAPADPLQQALTDRPELQIPDEDGQSVPAAEALEAAKPDTDYAAAAKAATDCFARRGA